MSRVPSSSGVLDLVSLRGGNLDGTRLAAAQGYSVRITYTRGV